MNADTAEIREGLANMETRLIYLENLHTQPDCRIEEEPKTPTASQQYQGYRQVISRREFDEWKGLVLHLHRKLNEHKDASKKKRTEEYRINI